MHQLATEVKKSNEVSATTFVGETMILDKVNTFFQLWAGEHAEKESQLFDLTSVSTYLIALFLAEFRVFNYPLFRVFKHEEFPLFKIKGSIYHSRNSVYDAPILEYLKDLPKFRPMGQIYGHKKTGVAGSGWVLVNVLYIANCFFTSSNEYRFPSSVSLCSCTVNLSCISSMSLAVNSLNIASKACITPFFNCAVFICKRPFCD